MFGLGCAEEYQLVSVWTRAGRRGKGHGEGGGRDVQPFGGLPPPSTCRPSPGALRDELLYSGHSQHRAPSTRMHCKRKSSPLRGTGTEQLGVSICHATVQFSRSLRSKLCAGGTLYGASIWVRCANARSCGCSALPAAVHRAHEVSPNSIHAATRGLFPAASTPPHAPQAAPSIGCGQQQPPPHGYQA